MKTLNELQEQIIAYVKDGKFVEGMLDFYAEDVVSEEPTGVKHEGLQALVAFEKEAVSHVTKFYGMDVISKGVGDDDGNGNGTTYIEYKVGWDTDKGEQVRIEQVQVNRWKNGKVKHVKFYYNA